MGVYIKGMKMPNRCVECVMCSFHIRGEAYCKLQEAPDDFFKGTLMWKKVIGNLIDENCPLVEVAESHGRLVDADMLRHMIDKTAAEPAYQHTGKIGW